LLTVPLFYERAKLFKKDTDRSIFSIDGRTKVHPDNGRALVDAQRSYILLEDKTGYKWSQAYLDSFEHFSRLMGATWFRELKEVWDAEIDAKLQARAIKAVVSLMEDPEAADSVKLASAKYVAEKGWERRHKASEKGRPSKADIAKAVKAKTEKLTQEDQDMERIGLKLVKNG